MTDKKDKEARATTAKQIARASQEEVETKTMDEVAYCYKVLTGLDPEDIVNEHGSQLQNHPQLMRIHITKTADALIRRAVELANKVDEYKESIIAEDAERVESYVYGETQYCPDRSELMSVLSQYGIVIAPAGTGWVEVTYGGPDFNRCFDKTDLNSSIKRHLEATKRILKKLGTVKRVQFVTYKNSPVCFVLWTNSKTNVKYICFARKDWKEIEPLAA